jgi:Zn-dependent protease
MGGLDIQRILLTLPGVLVGLVLHEYGHARAAAALGDPTPAAEGRLSLNPLRHIDPIGFLFLLVAGFGWAKPVHFSREYLKRPRRDEVLIALAGPAVNLVLAIAFALLIKLAAIAGLLSAGPVAQSVVEVLFYALFINLGLLVFNLIPIPPLDGSHVLFQSIRIRPETEAVLYRYGSMALLAILVIQSVTKINLLPINIIVDFLGSGMLRIIGIA